MLLKKIHKHRAFSLIEISIVVIIVGILISGISKGFDLYQDFRIATARQLTQNSRVGRINDLVLWLETSLINSVTGSLGNFQINDTNPILLWNDNKPQLSYKYLIGQSNATMQPIYKADGIGGLPSISFNGTNQLLINTSNGPIPANDKSYSFVIVFRAKTVTPGMMIVCQANNVGAYNQIGSVWITSGTYGFGGGDNDYRVSNMIADNDYISVVVVDNDLVNNVSIYTNSNTPSSGASQGGGGIRNRLTLSLGSLRFSIGGRIDNREYFNGLISEVIIFDRALRNDEVISINSYLSKKYSIKIL